MEEFDLNKNLTGAVLKIPNRREVWLILGIKGKKNVIYLTSTDSDNYYCNSNVCHEIFPNQKNYLVKPTRFKLVPRYLPLYTFQLYFPMRRIGWLDNVDFRNICSKLVLLNPE